MRGKRIEIYQNDTLYSVIDVFIDNFKIQCKSSSTKNGKKYNFTIRKRLKNKLIPYEISDGIDFFIFQIADEKYKDDMCIIPIKIMVEKGYIKTDKQSGAVCLAIPPKDYIGDNWIISYWNRFDLLLINDFSNKNI